MGEHVFESGWVLGRRTVKVGAGIKRSRRGHRRLEADDGAMIRKRPETVALGGVRFVGLIEFAEDGLELIGQDAAAGIRDGDSERVAGVWTAMGPVHRGVDLTALKRFLRTWRSSLQTVDQVFIELKVELRAMSISLEQEDAVACSCSRGSKRVRRSRIVWFSIFVMFSTFVAMSERAHELVLMMARYSVAPEAGEVRRSAAAGEARDGDDRRFELVREVVDEVGAEHLGSPLKLSGHGIEAVRSDQRQQAAARGMGASGCASYSLGGGTGSAADERVDRAGDQGAGKYSEHGAHERAEEDHRADVGDRRCAVIVLRGQRAVREEQHAGSTRRTACRGPIRRAA